MTRDELEKIARGFIFGPWLDTVWDEVKALADLLESHQDLIRLQEERVYGYHDPMTHVQGNSAMKDCPTCKRIEDLEARLKKAGRKETICR